MKKLIFILIFSILFFFPLTVSAQGIIVTDPISIGIQSVIQQITRANTAIQAAESQIQVQLQTLQYVRQGQQLMNQIQNMQSESRQLIGAVNNLESTTMMPASELEGLKNSLTAEETSLQNIIAEERSNPQLAAYLSNYNSAYGAGSLNQSTYTGQAAALQNQYGVANTQAAQTGAYAQGILNNSPQQQNLISQLGSNVAAAHGSVAAQQATGQAVVALTEEVNQTNKLLAEQAKLQAVQAGQETSAGSSSAATTPAPAAITPVDNSAAYYSPFGTYPNVTNFGK